MACVPIAGKRYIKFEIRIHPLYVHNPIPECRGAGPRQPYDGVDLQEEAGLLRKLPHLQRI